jgi:hypothetical protein
MTTKTLDAAVLKPPAHAFADSSRLITRTGEKNHDDRVLGASNFSRFIARDSPLAGIAADTQLDHSGVLGTHPSEVKHASIRTPHTRPVCLGLGERHAGLDKHLRKLGEAR